MAREQLDLVVMKEGDTGLFLSCKKLECIISKTIGRNLVQTQRTKYTHYVRSFIRLQFKRERPGRFYLEIKCRVYYFETTC